ncbi:MAG TPA: SRPBCC family protein [Steroidobacteraceae bacterium]|jgi:uncharacterized membrane protein|nr:SRPBCC family protein [Steroidobacteraceae bacterium]
MTKLVRSIGSALTGAVTAASVLYYFDATSGRRRRAQLGARSASATHHFAARLRLAGRHLVHRVGGLRARAVAGLALGGLDPMVLTERVRACLGRVVSHPGAIHVSVEPPRRVVLRGAVLAWEHEPLRRAVAAVHGVGELIDELAVHESAEHIPALQGGRVWRPRELPQQRWSPGTRLLVALAGGGLLFGGSRRRGAWGAVGAAAGSALLLRSAINAPLGEFSRGRHRRIEVRRTVQVRAPVERVFATLCDYQSLPQRLRHLTEVRRQPDGSTRWVVAGPLGTPIRWDAITTQIESNRLLAWRTVEGSPVRHWGMLRFERVPAGDTRVHVYLCCYPPAGRLGHALARVLGADPGSQFEQALRHLKQLLESADAAAAPQQGVDLAGDAT